ncbi:MAG: hypothetical protein MJA32_05105 [Proteobacteria bacterium]|nr:hypothetical protein [Pseudomonadota bacterium]
MDSGIRKSIDTLQRRFLQQRIRAHGIYDVAVVSYGGSGTTALARHLGKRLRVNAPNSDLDGILHASSPTHPVFADIDVRRAIYVFAHPAESVLSVFGRGFQARMVTKLRSRHRNRKDYVHALRQPDDRFTFEEFLRVGEDPFGLCEHLRNWTRPDTVPFPILNVGYDVLFESADTIAGFVGVPELSQDFPERRPRASRLDRLAPEQAERLTDIYRDAIELFDTLPDVRLHEPRN